MLYELDNDIVTTDDILIIDEVSRSDIGSRKL